MTTAYEPDGGPDLPDISEYNRLIAAEIRGEMAKKKVSQTEIARNVFGYEKPQKIQARIAGHVAMDGGEVLAIADYLDVNIVKIYRAAKRGLSPTPLGGLQATGEYPTLYVASHNDEPAQTVRPRGHLTLAARVA